MPYDKIDQLYDALKKDGAVSKSREYFRSKMLAPGKEGYQNRLQLYNALKADGAIESPTYEEFGKRLGLHAVNTAPVSKPQPQKPNTDSRVVAINTPQNPAQATPAKPKPTPRKAPAKQKGTPLTQVDKQKMLAFVNNMRNETNASLQRFNNRMDYHRANAGLRVPHVTLGKKNSGIKLGQNSKVVAKKPQFNPQSGKMEQTYITESGNEYTDRNSADLEQNTIDAYKDSMSVSGQLRDAYAERDRLDEAMKKRMKEIDERPNQRINDFMREFAASMTPGAGPVGEQDARMSKYDNDDEYMQLMAAARKNHQTIQLLEDKKNNQMNSFWHSLATTASNGYTFTDGMSEMRDATALQRASKHIDTINKKREEGKTLTKEEQTAEAVLKNFAKDNAMQSMYGGDYDAWARAGGMTANSLDFMKDLMLNPGAGNLAKGIMRGTAKSIAKGLAKVTGKEAAQLWKNNVLRRTLKATGVLLGAHTAGAYVSNTTGIGRTSATMGTLASGEVGVDDKGNYKVENAMGLLPAFAEAERQQARENGSEMFGEFIPGVGGVVKKGLEKIGLSKLSGAMTNIGNKEWYKQYSRLLESGGYNGLPGEALEEYEGSLFDALTGHAGDAWDDMTNLQNHVDIWLGCATMGALLGSVPMMMQGHHTAQYYRYKHNTDKADNLASFRMTAERWEPLRDEIDNTDNSKMADVVTGIINNPDLHVEEKKAALNYVRNLTMMRGYNIAQVNNASDEEEERPEVQSVNDSYSKGYETTEPQDMNDTKSLLELKREQVAKEHGIENVDEVDALIGDDPLRYIEEQKQLGNTDKLQSVIDYANAKSAYDGMVQRVQDDIDNRVEESNATVNSRVNRTDGMIHPTSLKLQNEDGSDKTAYIVSGTIVMLEDGTGVDTQKSDKAVVVRDAYTGELKWIDSSLILNIDEPIDPEVEKKAASDAIIEEMSQTAANKVDGVVSFKEGDTYTLTDKDGEQTQVTLVVNEQGLVDNGDGTVNVTVDGQNVVPMSMEDIQSGVDATNMARTMQAEQERQANENAPNSDESVQNDGESVQNDGESVQNDGESVEEKPDGVEYGVNDTFTLLNGEDEIIHGEVQGVSDDGVEIRTDEPLNGKRVQIIPAEEFEEMVESINDADGNQVWAREYAEDTEDTNETEETSDNSVTQDNDVAPVTPTADELVRMAREGNELAQHQLEAQGVEWEEPSEHQPTALERVPINEATQEPMFEKADRETALDALNELTGGNEENTSAIINAQVEQATKALEALKKKAPKKKAPALKGSPMEMLKVQKEADDSYNTTIEEYNAQVATAEENLNAWTSIYSLMGDRKRAAREQLNAERNAMDEQLHAEAVAKLEEDKRIAAEKAAEQAEVGTHAVNPKIKGKWDGATKVEGNPNAITLADGSTIRGHYVLTEAGAATASHDVNNAYEPTEGFPVDENGESVNDRDYKRDTDAQRIVRDMADSYDSRALQTPVIVSKDGVVLSGNNRTMSGEIAAKNGTDKAYVEHLREFGSMFGFTPEQIDGMQHPRVVFVPDEELPYDASTFARFNAEQQKKQSKPEHAVKLGKIVPDNVFASIVGDISRFDRMSDYYADGNAVSSAIGQLLEAGVINEMQLPELRTGNALSAAGKELIENTLIGKVFQASPDAVRQIISTPTLRQSVVMGLNEISNNRTLAKSDYDLSKELAAAVDLVNRAKSESPEIYKEGMPVSPYGRQQGLFDDEYGDSRVTDGVTLILADILNSGKPSDLRKFLSIYNNEAASPASGQLDMFSGGVTSKEELLNRLNEYFRNATPKEQQAIVDASVAERKQRAEAAAQNADGTKRDGEEPTDIQGESNGGVSEAHVGLNDDEANELLSRMEDNTSEIPQIELNPTNWIEQFGENGMVSTPLGKVKMGENQIAKLFEKGRSEQFGMIKPTLEHPHVIVEVPSEASDGNTERASSLLFIKTFNGTNGKKVYYFKSVTVKKDGLEVSVSSHYDRAKRVKEALKKGKLLYRFDGGAQTERHPADVSVTTSPKITQGNDNMVWKHADDVSDASDVAQGLYSSQGNVSDLATEGTDAPQTNMSNNIWSASEVQNDNSAVASDGLQSEPIAENDSTSNGTPSKNEEYSRHATTKQSVETIETSQDAEQGDTQTSSSMNVPTSSFGKVINNQSTLQENAEKSVGREGETSLSAQIEAASAKVNTEPTEAQKEAGNYKKGHVQVGTFDITIEQPQGSVRKGTDANGKQWESKMNNTYGYIRGAVGVDGDHIDVFLSNDIDGWNGRKVFVVDQYNPDGSFDEHKVMLGFNDADEAKSDYLANYENGWEDGRKIVVSAVNLEDFEKWIASSKRKTKPFGEYSSVKKDVVERNKVLEYEKALDHLEDVEQEWEDKIQDYVSEHYPTQATTSAESTSEKGLQERKAMKADPVLKQMYAEAKKEIDAADEMVTQKYSALPEDLRQQKAVGKSAQPPTREETILRDVVIEHMKGSGLDVIGTEDGQRVLDMANEADVRFGAKQKRALETATIAEQSTNNATVVSSADGAKVQKILETLADNYEKRSNKTRGFITDLSRSLGLVQHEASQYGTFETRNGKLVTIRVSNHNARVSFFDENGEEDGISIVISSHKNKGVLNDGKAHLVEYFYPKQSLERSGGKPLADIVKCVSTVLESGKFEDTTGLAQRQEVNAQQIREHRVYHGSGAEFDAFDHSHMGEGEGSQSFGWGTYVTNSETIGKSYANRAKADFGLKRNELESDISRAKEQLPFVRGEVKEELEAKIRDWETKLENFDNGTSLYTVEIPEDNGKNYLDWRNSLPDGFNKEAVKERIMQENRTDDEFENEMLERDLSDSIDYATTGMELYKAISLYIGDKAASKMLYDMGFVGIKYPAGSIHGGVKEGDTNYVIFNEKDAQITDHVRFFRTANGEAYGFTIGGKIYIDPKVATSETPVHEYAHLWATALKACNPKEWQNVVSLMKGTSVWDEVKSLYSELKSDDEIADEVLATYSGRRGAERLREERRKIAKGNGGVFEKAEAISALDRVKRALKMFWKGVADFLHIHYTSAEDVADRVMKDLLDGVDPRSMMNGGNSLRPDTEINVVEGTKEHGFKKYAEAKTWAKEHIARTYSGEETGGKGDIRISNAAINKYLSQSAVDKSDSKDVHLSVLKVLPDVIRESVDAEQHADYKKGEDGVRSAKNGINPNVTIHRLYGAVRMGGRLYRVKVTLKEDKTSKEPKVPHSYEATKIELFAGTLGNSDNSLSPSTNNSITAAKLLNGVEKSYDGGKFFEDYNKVREQFIGEQGAERADHAEEVSTRLDNLSVAREMEADKKDAKAIKMATGWERGADGKWRYEIADMKEFDRNGNLLYRKHHPDYARYIELQDKDLNNLFEDGEELTDKEREEYEVLSKKYESDKFGGEKLDNNHTLEAYVDAPELFKAYPELKDVGFRFEDTGGNEIASYRYISSVFEVDKDDVGEIVVNTGKVSKNTRTREVKSAVLHEMQHAIQEIEGFARGGNPKSMQERFEAAKKEWRARAWADALRDKADEMGEHYNQVAVEKALIDEYKEMGMDNEEWMPDKETRMKGFNYFARGYADRSMDADIKIFRLNESTRADFSPYVEYTRLGGEVESRNVEARMSMSAEERRASLAAETEDVSREDQLFLFGNNEGGSYSLKDGSAHLGRGKNVGEASDAEGYTAFANQYGVDAEVVKDYASGMKTGNLQKAEMALAEIRRTMRVANRGMKLSEFGKLFRPVQKELTERYGDIEKLRQEYIDAVMRERGVMEAARKRAEEEETKRKAHLEEMSLLSTEELNKRYFDAIENGDEGIAREMLDEVARRNGYDDTESDYQGVGAWSAPSNPGYESDAERRADVEDNAPCLNLEDMALGYQLQPDDYFTHPERYFMNTPHGRESSAAIRTALEALKRGEKGVKVKVYRAVPTSVKEGKLRNGDWVTPSKKYAEMHGNGRLEGKYRIIEDEVPASELWWDGNDGNEWGFDDGRGYKYKNVEHNRKLNDLVTRDDNGEIIPPSKRFDENVEDVRYRESEPMTLKGEEALAALENDSNAMVDRVTELSERLHTPVRIIRTEEEVAALPSARQRRMKGSFNPLTGEVTIVVPNNANMADIENTFVHEVVGHDGLRVLFPDEAKLNNALDELYRVSNEGIQQTIDRMAQKMYDAEVDRIREKKRKEHDARGEDVNASYYADMAEAHAEASKKREQFKRDATEEYGADLAGRIGEKGFEQMSAEELTFWGKLKAMLQKALQKLLDGLKIPGKKKWGDKDWAFVLHEAYKRKKNGGKPTVFDAADTEVMRRKTGFGDTKFSDGYKKSAKHGEARLNAFQLPSDAGHNVQPSEAALKHLKPTETEHDAKVLQNREKAKEALANVAETYRKVTDTKGFLTALKDAMGLIGNGSSAYRAFELPNGDSFVMRVSNHNARAHNVKDGERVESIVIKRKHTPNRFEPAKGKVVDEYVYFKEDIRKAPAGTLSAIAESISELLDTGEYRDKTGLAKDNHSPETDLDGGIMFRDGDSEEYEKAMARDIYEQRVSRGMFQTQEAVQDSMLGLKEAMDAILKAEDEDVYIEDVAGYENAYLGENRLSSVNQAECSAFAQTLFKPLLEEVAKLAKTADERAELTDYMMAKHGLERNQVMARRAAEKDARSEFSAELLAAQQAVDNDPLDQDAIDALDDVTQRMQDREDELYLKNRERDFAGLTALTGMNNVLDAEAEAQQMVSDYESNHWVPVLWNNVKAVTKATLQKTYESGLINKATYDDISGMYETYIPLRGFDDQTSDEVYAYLADKHSAFNAPIKTAKGRKSKADDPFANMEAMAESAIMQGNRNVLVKQKFLNFALNHPSDLVSVSDLWLYHDDVLDEWQPINTGGFVGTEAIEEDDSPAEVERKMRDFEEAMENAAKVDPDHFKKQKDHPEIPYRVVESRDLKQHQVLVKRNGKDYLITINGNPRAAQALNGQTNPDNDVSGAIGAIMRLGETVNRQLSAFYTTRNPDFVVSNFIRDMIYANTMVWVKESPNYAWRFHKNFAKVNPAKMKILLAKMRNGTLDMNDETEKMFHLFMMNGGETGYANIRDIEQRKNDIKRELKKYNGKIPIRKAWTLLGERLDEYNRAVENCARFAAFMTSRQLGRTIDRSVYDAKEISVNFNKKGSGAKFMGANSQTRIGNVAAFTSGLGRSFYVFWNAAIQGTTNFGRQFKRHPQKAIAGAAAMFLFGALMAIIGSCDGGDDDDDKNAYYNLPEYVRRSNIVFRLPGMDQSWISMPLPVEYRAMYGMGELMVSAMIGNEHYTAGELAHQMASQVSQMFPIDFMEGGGSFKAFVPSAIKPVAEVIGNESWTGMPIYKDTPFNKDMPEWTKAYKSANKYLVGLSKVLNEATGGDAYTSGMIDINPAQVEYMLNGVFGGVSSTIDKLTKMGETIIGNREYDPRSFLLLNRLVKNGDERTEYRAVNNEYFRIKEESEKLRTRLNHYENDTADGVFDYAEKIAWLNNSPEYRILETYEDYSGDIDDINEELKAATSDEERKELEAELNEKKKELVDAVNNIRNGKQQ